MDYGDSKSPPASKPAPAKKSMTKMSDKQKADLTKHMKKTGLTGREAKSHRMSMMGRMRKGMSVGDAHKDIMKA
jgi:hypothetical protein